MIPAPPGEEVGEQICVTLQQICVTLQQLGAMLQLICAFAQLQAHLEDQDFVHGNISGHEIFSQPVLK